MEGYKGAGKAQLCDTAVERGQKCAHHSTQHLQAKGPTAH